MKVVFNLSLVLCLLMIAGVATIEESIVSQHRHLAANSTAIRRVYKKPSNDTTAEGDAAPQDETQASDETPADTTPAETADDTTSDKTADSANDAAEESEEDKSARIRQELLDLNEKTK